MFKKQSLHPYWWGLIVNVLMAGVILALYCEAR